MENTRRNEKWILIRFWNGEGWAAQVSKGLSWEEWKGKMEKGKFIHIHYPCLLSVVRDKSGNPVKSIAPIWSSEGTKTCYSIQVEEIRSWSEFEMTEEWSRVLDDIFEKIKASKSALVLPSSSSKKLQLPGGPT